MGQSHQKEAKPLRSPQNAHVDANPATTSDLVASQQSRKRTASDARINKNQSNEHQQNGLNIHVANADGVPSKKTRKAEVTESRSKKCPSTSGKMDMTMFCRHDIVTSTPKPNPYALPIHSVNHASTTQLSPIQKQSLPLSGLPHNPFTNIVKRLEDIQKIVLHYAGYQNVPSMPCETVEDSSVPIIDLSLRDAPGRNGGVPVAEDVIVISDSDSSNIPGPSARTNIKRKATKNNQTKRRQQQKTKDPKKDIPVSKEQVPTSSIHLQDCPICFAALDNKSISSTNCGHIFCTPCITKMIKSTNKCPTCRTPLIKTKIHPLFIKLFASEVLNIKLNQMLVKCIEFENVC